MNGLDELGMSVPIRTRPVEIEMAIPFEQDEFHATYDRDQLPRCGNSSTRRSGSCRCSAAASSASAARCTSSGAASILP